MKYVDHKEISPVKRSAKSVTTVNIRCQQGMGIIEVMIGVLIFVGGIISISGMQTQSIRTTHDSIQRSQAVWLANAVAELMKINVAGLEDSAYQSAASRASANRNSYCSSIPKQCIGSSCSPAEMAAFDIHDLMCRNGHNMINPAISISCSSGCPSGSEVTIRVSWDSRGAVDTLFMTRQQVAFAYQRN